MNPYTSSSDEQVFSSFLKSGDKQLLVQLFKKHFTMLIAVAIKYLEDRETAKDLVMDVFEKLLRLPGKSISIPLQFKAWIYTFTRNECLMFLRKKKNQTTGEKIFEEDRPLFMEKEEELHLKEEQRIEELYKYLKDLPEDQELCVRAFYLEKKSYHQIMEMYGLDFNEVKSAIQNGKRNLKLMFLKNQNSASTGK